MVEEKGEPTPGGEREFGVHPHHEIPKAFGEERGERHFALVDQMRRAAGSVRRVEGAKEIRKRVDGLVTKWLTASDEDKDKIIEELEGIGQTWNPESKSRRVVTALRDAMARERRGEVKLGEFDQNLADELDEVLGKPPAPRPERRPSEKREEVERPFGDLELPDLIDRLKRAKAGLEKGKPGEPEYEEAEEGLPALEKEMSIRTDGLYGLIQDLGQDLEAGKKIGDQLGEARREATRLRKKDRETGRFVNEMVDDLEREMMAKEKAKLRPEARDLRLPEVPPEVRGQLMKNAKRGEDLPAAYLSQLFTTLKDIELPLKEREAIRAEEGETVMAMVYPVETLAQAVKAGLTELDNMILENRNPFDRIQKSIIRYYVGIVRDWAGKDSRVYQDMNTLVEGTFNLFEAMHGTWLPRKGKKHLGIKDTLSAVSGKLPTRLMWFFRQDPEIESATHRLKGEIDHDAFKSGAPNRGELGDVLGGDYGAAEKIGYFISLLDYQGVFVGYGPVRRACYNALYLRNTLEVLGTKGIYENVIRLFEPVYTYLTREGERKGGLGISPAEKEIAEIPVGGIVYRRQYGIVPYPSAHHSPTINTEWTHDNFREDRLGWKNLARMLVIYGEHDPRFHHWRAGEKGYYTIEQWLFASPERQREMYQAAWQNFQALDEGIKKRIIKNNLLGIYDFAVKQENGKLKWLQKPLLDYDERDDKGRYIIDIGSLDRAHWCGGFEGDYLNEFYTAEEYAWRTFNRWNDLCQTDMIHQMERFKGLLGILTADEGYRHLTEYVEKGRPVAMLAERRRQIEHLFTTFSESWLGWIWADRREGRRNPDNVPLNWELGVNERLRLGLDMDRYREEFETAGVFGIDYTNTYENLDRYGYQEKVGKVLSKFENKDAWITYLKGVVELDQEICRVLDVSLEAEGRQRLFQLAERIGLIADLEEQERNGRVWQFYPEEIGPVREILFSQANARDRARIVLDELSYRTLVYFAGFKIDKEFLEYDQYGLPVWRTWFDFDFDLETGEGRGDGEVRKAIYNDGQWRRMEGFLLSSLDDDLYSPFKFMNEKLEEDTVEGGIGEANYRATFDKDKRNYTPQRWRGRKRRDKKRWDMYSHMYRNRRYTVGKLKGRYVMSQLEIEVNPKTRLPRFENSRTGEIIEVRETTPEGWIINHPMTDQPVEIKADEITGLPVITDPENFRVRLFHDAQNPGELPTPKIAWFSCPDCPEFPGLVGHDRVGTMTWGTEGVWSTRKVNEGMGMGGLEKQLTWEPPFYNKNIRLAFFRARYGDPEYIFEVGRNTGKEWEVHQLYHLVMDEEQRLALFRELDNMGEDVGWVMAEAARDGVNAGVVEEYKDTKKDKRIPDVTGEVPAGATEEQMINLSDLVKTIVPLPAGLKGMVPIIRSGTERTCVLRALVIGEVPAVTIATAGVLTATDPLRAILILIGSQIPPIWFAKQMVDKGVDKQGREKARGLTRGIQSFLGLGMFGNRKRVRNPYSLAFGWEPVHDSALPLDKLVEYWFTLPKYKLVRMRVGY